MALGKRKPMQTSLWVDARHLQAHPAHPFYRRLNGIPVRAQFDRYVERLCRKYYAPVMGRPSIAPGVYFRCFLVGYFEGIDSERGIAYRIADSLSLREFLGLSPEDPAPDQSTLSKRDDLQSLRVTVAETGSVATQMAGQAAEADAVGPVKAVSEVGGGTGGGRQGLSQRAGFGGAGRGGRAQRDRRAGTEAAMLGGPASGAGGGVCQSAETEDPDGPGADETARGLDGEELRPSAGNGRPAAGDNLAKRLLIHAAAFDVSLILRQLPGVGTAPQAADLLAALCFWVLRLMYVAHRRALVLPLRRLSARTTHSAAALPSIPTPSILTFIHGLSGVLVLEDFFDRYVVRGIERWTRNPVPRAVTRGLLNPNRAFAKLMRRRVLWHRDSRPGVLEP